jgi:hypothetical protein
LDIKKLSISIDKIIIDPKKKKKIQNFPNFFIEKWRNFARKIFTGPSLTVQFKSLFYFRRHYRGGKAPSVVCKAHRGGLTRIRCPPKVTQLRATPNSGNAPPHPRALPYKMACQRFAENFYHAQKTQQALTKCVRHPMNAQRKSLIGHYV